MILSRNAIILSLSDAYTICEMLEPIFKEWLLSDDKKMTDKITVIDKLKTVLREANEEER